MPRANLLLRERLSGQSLSAVVERSQRHPPPHPAHDLRVRGAQLEISAEVYTKPPPQDEGFESDIDTLSIVSSDDSLTSSTCFVDDHVKSREVDSAHGSSSSESDTETTTAPKKDETHHLVDVMCYTEVKTPDLLIIVIKDECLVFRFGDVGHLQEFYGSFSALKAVANQRAYGNGATKFNLLQRTDRNGVTHIEITKDFGGKTTWKVDSQRRFDSATINRRKLETNWETQKASTISRTDVAVNDIPEQYKTIPNRRKPDLETFKTTHLDGGALLPNRPIIADKPVYTSSTFRKNSVPSRTKSDLQPSTSETHLHVPEVERVPQPPERPGLTKVWKSAEDILDAPRRPERRKKPKGKAPPPPTNVMKGEFVRVAVDPKKPLVEPPKVLGENIQTFSPNWSDGYGRETLRAPKPEPRSNPGWSNSVPRLLKKQRSRSETRNVFPLAHRYVDATRHPTRSSPHTATISNRLFGLSQRLKEFGSNVVGGSNRPSTFYDAAQPRRNSLGEMTYKAGTEGNLKSVIKKEDRKRGSEQKKVTFSAYATVQVV